jgi:hypothetical protein
MKINKTNKNIKKKFIKVSSIDTELFLNKNMKKNKKNSIIILLKK